MKFSFFMMPLHHPKENPALAFQRDISLIHLADDLDFDEFMIGEHHSGGWETMPLPEMALSMAAANAHRIRLGTSVVNLPFHHPFHVAERIAFLDHLTRGRAILGHCESYATDPLAGLRDHIHLPAAFQVSGEILLVGPGSIALVASAVNDQRYALDDIAVMTPDVIDLLAQPAGGSYRRIDIEAARAECLRRQRHATAGLAGSRIESGREGAPG